MRFPSLPLLAMLLLLASPPAAALKSDRQQPLDVKADSTEGTLRGRKYILVDEWGPYDFSGPRLWPARIEGGETWQIGALATVTDLLEHAELGMMGEIIVHVNAPQRRPYRLKPGSEPRDPDRTENRG